MADHMRGFAGLQRSHIGRALPRPNAERLSRGAARYTTDIDLPGLLHVAFLRSPYAHARIVSIDAAAALAIEGVVAVVTGADLAQIARPFEAKLDHLPKLKAPDGLGEKLFKRTDEQFIEYAMRDSIIAYHIGLSLEKLHDEFGTRFQLVKHLTERHQTPAGAIQQFIYCYCSIAENPTR